MSENSFKAVYAFAREIHRKTLNKTIQYGTAGFRSKGIELGYVLYRMGLLASLRARYKKEVVGLMITASHNPEPDNGVKLVDPKGEMLEESWEKLATKIVNVSDDELIGVIEEIVNEYNIDMNYYPDIFLGKDTRPSSTKLCEAAIDGILALKGRPTDFGVITTPMLHYFVVCKNTNGEYGECSENGYYKKLLTAFKNIREIIDINMEARKKYQNKICFDGANGVGAKKIKLIQESLRDFLNIEIFNNSICGTGLLNNKCGADFVKVQQTSPETIPKVANEKCCSVDGDADRLVYYFYDDNTKFNLLDGDKIATLISSYLMKLIQISHLDIKLGLVQTAYANGASTNFILNNLKVSVTCTETGVKHLHKEAQKYDIGVYFEANGHGTILFSDATKKIVTDHYKKVEYLESVQNSEEHMAIKILKNLIDLTNETVGDAMSDMLLVEIILYALDLTTNDWLNSYLDYPNRQLKIIVKDKNIIKTTDASRKCIEPVGLQQTIDTLLEKYENSRAFVRPSGTEDIVRVYAEAKTREQCDKLACEVADKVYEMCGGVGKKQQV